MASNIGRLTVDLRLASQKFEASLKKATANLTTFRNRANTAVKSIGGMQARIAGLVGVAGFGAMISGSLKAGDSIAKLSDRVGISTESLSALQHMAELNGESIEGLDKSIEKMSRSIGEASRGIGTGKKAFEELGISINQLQGLNAEERFLTIAEAIKGVGDKSLQASYASDIFGRSGIKLINTLDQGREGFEAAKNEVESLGLALNRVDAAKIEAANDAILRAQKAIKGVSLQASSQLSPLIEAVATAFTESATQGNNFGETVKNVITGSSKVVGVFADGIHGISIILKTVELAVKGFGTVWATVLDTVVNQGLIPFANKINEYALGPIKDVLSFASEYSDTAKQMLNELSSFEGVKNVDGITNFADSMKESLESSRVDLQNAMMKTIPSVAMKAKIDEVFETANENALKKAQDVKDQLEKTLGVSPTVEEPVTEPEKGSKEETSDEEKIAKKRSYLERVANLEIGQSKKVAAIQRAIKLKQLIMNKFKAISEAVASAPFPANIPAIALATAESFAALSGFKSAGSFEGGGYTGRGARVGGIDGRGGIPVTVHPNEMIIDLDKQKAQSLQTVKSGSTNTNNTTISISNMIQGSSDDILSAIERQPRRLKRIIQSVSVRPI
ncbi:MULTISPECIES: hypothetical protein [unclassified Alteromonas]|uniref:hypothetical protein n=1 Tax=unclassified Alteromonas TaxID=2614992 RepID=UPI00068AB472|nr:MULTISPECIES: hypothetical protein [unclassified Alteromonas]